MNFEKYRSIENAYQTAFIEKIINEGKSNGTWVVHEKIHGANFSMWHDGTAFKFASRSGFISEDAAFYGFQRLIENMKQFMRRIWTIVDGSIEYGEVKELVVFGEIFGGSYNHPDVAKQNVSCVQKGLYYSPSTEFMAFDIKINGKYINVSDATAFVKAAGFFRFAPQLFAGTLQQCLAYPNFFNTTIPSVLGLPSIDNNTCEGVVIRPNDDRELYNGARIIIKNKNDKFKEKHDAPSIPKITEPVSEAVLELLTKVSAYVNEKARVASAISKIGEVSMKDFGKVHGDVLVDAREAYHKDGLNEENLTKEDATKFGKLFARVCAEAVRKFIMKSGAEHGKEEIT